jgi:hypothetical protein
VLVLAAGVRLRAAWLPQAAVGTAIAERSWNLGRAQARTVLAPGKIPSYADCLDRQ